MIDIRTSIQKQAGSFTVPMDWGVASTARGMKVLVLDNTFHTAVIISIFSDRRAERDDVLPHNQTDRRGWCGDEIFAQADGDQWGSKLWQFYVSKATDEVEESARFTVQESLQWMVRDRLAENVDVTTEWFGESNDKLALRVRIWRSIENARPDYDVVWDSSVRRITS